MKRILLLFILLQSILSVYSQIKVTGRVSCGNKSLSNVMVTDGFICVNTDINGSFSFVTNPTAKFVYISIPAGYISNVENGSVPAFFKRIESSKTEYNFNLLKNPKDDFKHTFFVQSDVQVADAAELEKYKLIVDDAKEYLKKYSKNDIFGLDCGDMVGDKPELYPGYLKYSGSLNIPIYRTMGNHDMIYYGRSFETSQSRFENQFGPTYYSFDKGKAHYIVINNSFYIGREYFYMGYIDEKTYSWIEKDLKNVPYDHIVIMTMHIPTILDYADKNFTYNGKKVANETVNRTALYEMLKPYNAHIITGHMHVNGNVVITPTLMEHNTGAACGTWYQLDGCVDGTPSGYAVYEVNGNKIKWHFKGAGYPPNYQIRVYGLNQSAEYPNDILVNVWNYDPLWKVEWIEDGKEMGNMQQCEALDPHITNQCKDTSKMKYSWIGAAPTKHMFRATPKNPHSKTVIRVTDRFGNEFNEEIK